MVGQKDKSFAGFRIDKTDPAQMLRILLPCVEAVKRDGLIEAQPCPLVDANELRDWRIWADIAAVLVRRARKLYLSDDIGLDLANKVYALDSTTIDLCLSLFPWAGFRSTKAAVKMHTLLDLRGPIPSFIHISDGKMGDAAALDLIMPEAGAIYVMDRGRFSQAL